MVANIGIWPETDSRTAPVGRTISGTKTATNTSGRERAPLTLDENVVAVVNANMIVGINGPGTTIGRGGAHSEAARLTNKNV